MPRRIPDETLHAIRDRISIVEVVSAYVSLKRAGRNFVGLCPFHSEKTPSFTVSDERGLFHCFGCGESGTVFTFLMKIERLEFVDAVAQLAKRASVALPAHGEDDPAARRREQLYAANAAAERWFRQMLAAPAGAAARHYLAGRGLREDTVARFGLGFAPAGGSVLATWLAKQGIAGDVAVEAGLLGRGNDRRSYDRFRGRIMFPIRDRRGRTIAFGGRTLGADQPKYLNSPESPLFRKGDGVYGAAEARDAIRTAGRVVLVEGYMDALVLAQEGIGYTVATLGTAVTVAQLQLVSRLGGDEVTLYFFFDGDRAGRQAALRAFGICAEAGVWGRAVFLADGFDPDTYTRQHGVTATLALLDAAPPLIDCYFDAMLPAGATLPERMRVAEDVTRLLARVHNDVQFEMLARHAAARLGVSEEVLRRGRRPAAAPRPVPAPTATGHGAWPAAERLLIELMAADRSVATWEPARAALGRFESVELREAGSAVAAAAARGEQCAVALDRVSPALATMLSAAALAQGTLEPDERRRAAEDCVQRIAARAARQQRQALASALRVAERSGDARWRDAAADLTTELRRKEGGGG
jgi:DNA primase